MFRGSSHPPQIMLWIWNLHQIWTKLLVADSYSGSEVGREKYNLSHGSKLKELIRIMDQKSPKYDL